MIIIHGVYRFLPKRVAYRDGWCNKCQRITHAQKFKTWNVFHLYGIPLLPLGRISTLRCNVCKKDPTARHQESVSMLVIGVVCFSLMLLAALFAPVPPGDQGTMWVARVVLAVLIGVCALGVRSRLKHGPVTPRVHTYANDQCMFCQGHLITMLDDQYCEKCDLLRLNT